MVLKTMKFARHYFFVVLASLAMSSHVAAANGHIENHTKIQNTQAIIAFFNDQGKLSKIATNNGYYRVLIDRNLKGDYYVQDYFQAEQTPQTSPFWITRQDKIFSFDEHIHEGTATFFRKNQSKLGTSTVSQGIEYAGQGFYLNGKQAVSYHLTPNNQYQTTLWYESGNKAAEYLADKSHNILSGRAWDIHGNQIEDIQSLKKTLYALWQFE